MADKVKLTPPMTDSKTQEWAAKSDGILGDYLDLSEPRHQQLSNLISQAILSAYERGRSGAAEALPDEIDLYQMLKREGLRKRADIAKFVARTIRQLLEVKG